MYSRQLITGCGANRATTITLTAERKALNVVTVELDGRTPTVNGVRTSYYDTSSRDIYITEDKQFVVKVEPYHNRYPELLQCVVEKTVSDNAKQLGIADCIAPTVALGAVKTGRVNNPYMFWSIQPYIPFDDVTSRQFKPVRERLLEGFGQRMFLPDTSDAFQYRRTEDGDVVAVDYGFLLEPETDWIEDPSEIVLNFRRRVEARIKRKLASLNA